MESSGVCWESARAAVAALIAVVLVATGGALWSGITGDRLGALLFGLAAVVLAAVTVPILLLRPRLRADLHGIQLRTLSGRVTRPWEDVQATVVRTHRLGREVETLELELDHPDGNHSLHVLGRFELGADPADVLAHLLRVRAR